MSSYSRTKCSVAGNRSWISPSTRPAASERRAISAASTAACSKSTSTSGRTACTSRPDLRCSSTLPSRTSVAPCGRQMFQTGDMVWRRCNGCAKSSAPFSSSDPWNRRRLASLYDAPFLRAAECRGASGAGGGRSPSSAGGRSSKSGDDGCMSRSRVACWRLWCW
ncbi:hypothetical protein GSI_01038 [Ganoderma sinense ZZ0214-1]|uniref:Uncharacterized protein n=1 Tax=Ganoderma sinense ZZ0214-1 TaxID=1077348 RepID=A0A2G8SU97_9APHY|nr:hypothetical protein GSI_01038 [Ganoderma sinense ZZ0214-1]